MKTLLRLLALGLLLLIASCLAGYFYFQQQMRRAHTPAQPTMIVEIGRGMGTRDIVHLLHDNGLVDNEYVALAYVMVSGSRGRLKAGEYMFDKPMTVPEVFGKIVSGSVYLHKFTVPEGLTLHQIAQKWEEDKFGTADAFRSAAQDSVSLIESLDAKATSLEGYLYPETYSFPAHVTAPEAVDAMVGRFKSVIATLQKEVPAEQWPLDLRGTVILASLVESEAAVSEERPIIASVYLNRLNQKILLQCDPTVIYALEQADRYHGQLTLADLKYSSPYNTYLYPGLPPSAITNPGYPSLQAAVQPMSTAYLYFVRTEGGRHTFSDSLAAHNRAVAKYRLLERRK